MSKMKRPLEGVKVLELATFIAGPCCARFLADLGAEVIKVEAPNGRSAALYRSDDEGRPFGDKEDTSFTLENTGKKCVILNTKSVGRACRSGKTDRRKRYFYHQLASAGTEKSRSGLRHTESQISEAGYGVCQRLRRKGSGQGSARL